MGRNVSSRIDERGEGEKKRTRGERESVERAIERARDSFILPFFFSPPPPPPSLSLLYLFCSASRAVVIIMACTHCTDTALS